MIVPVGAKGGFAPKQLPAGGGREAIQAEGEACYKSFIRALLDVTDNLVEGEVIAYLSKLTLLHGKLINDYILQICNN